MKKNGFVSTSLIYTFFILFLLLMVFLLNSYSSIRFLLEQFKYDIKNSFASASVADINLYFMVWDENTKEYELHEEIPTVGYNFEPNYSYCQNGSRLSYENGNILVASSRKDSCYAYFRESDNDIILKIYTKENEDSERKLVKDVPNFSYELSSQKCSNGAKLIFDEETRRFKIQTTEKTECEVEFIKREMDIILHFYKENASGNHELDNGTKYESVSDVPGLNYSLSSVICNNENTNTVITVENGELVVESDGKNECNVYFNGGSSKVELIIMKETETGISGYTTGKKYTRVASSPEDGYKYVGYICDNSNVSVKYYDGTFETYLESNDGNQAICRVYFNKYSDRVYIHYFLETSDGSYENVAFVPSVGYAYNKTESSCINGSKIIVNNNIVTIDTDVEDECSIYYDMTNADIKVNVFVMNRETGLYSLGSVPVAGYEFYNAGCTNGASILYNNGSLQVTADGPTVCTVYFR